MPAAAACLPQACGKQCSELSCGNCRASPPQPQPLSHASSAPYLTLAYAYYSLLLTHPPAAVRTLPPFGLI